MVGNKGLKLLCAVIASLFIGPFFLSRVVALESPLGFQGMEGDPSSIPTGEAGAKDALDKSPRHHEWVKIPITGSQTKLNSFMVYPERKDKVPVVIVIMEIFGLTDWVRAVADHLAEDGFIAVAPDLLSGRGPGGGGTEAFGARHDVIKAVSNLSSSDVANMLNAVADYATALPSATQKFATVGFCWGGGQSFAYAAAQPKLGAAVVYYGVSPALEALDAINAPVLGLYGEDDTRVVTTIEPAEKKMTALGKVYIKHIYKGAGHAFLRAQQDRSGGNLEASKQAWPATVEFLKKYLEQGLIQ
jgi:carboxymethylenebutenolidase